MERKPIMPPACLLASIVIMVGLHFLLPVKTLVPSPHRYLGILPLLLGTVVNIWADRLFKRVRTTVKPFEESSCLVTAGPYRFSRHPMYLGMVLMLAGLAVLLGSATPMPIVPAFAWVIDRKFVRPEEKAMEQTLPDAYRRYKRRVRRWV